MQDQYERKKESLAILIKVVSSLGAMRVLAGPEGWAELSKGQTARTMPESPKSTTKGAVEFGEKINIVNNERLF